MLYTIITIGLIFLSALVLLPRFKTFTDRYSLSINYFLTLVATFVGVLLAISITNHEADRKEQEDVVKLLRSSITSVETCFDYTKTLFEYHAKLADDDPVKPEFYIKNPPPYPDYLEAFLMQNLVSKNLSGDTLSDLNEQIINLQRVRTNKVDVYLEMLEKTKKILLVELSYQKEEINLKQLDAQLDEL